VRVAVLNGVNLDVLHRRNPELYGGLTLNQLESSIYEWARELEVIAECRQTNSEGEYVGWCHDALDWADGVIANPGAWSHYSYAIRDALELFEAPVVEVHLSDISTREDWRRHTVIEEIATQRVIGKGPEGYREALRFLAGKDTA
jgi:3-dehydroquinate dehydratase-2